jgi:lambda family phage portal protein
MIGEAVDKVVSWFSPAWAASRAHARRVLERGYDAASKNRLNTNRLPANSSADQELYTAANTIRANARDLARNNAYAQGVLRALDRNVVGSGIRPQARIENADELNKRLEKLFSRWAREADVTGRLTFYELQRLAYHEVNEAGECLIHFTRLPDRSRAVPFALELIDADRLADDMHTFKMSKQTENEIRRGVEIDATGRAVAYWVYPYHPYDVSGRISQAVRVDARECIHLYRQQRIGQTRGVSIFAPVLRWLEQLGYYVDNELQASAVASCFTAVIKSFGGPSDGGLLSEESSNTDTDGNTFEYMQPGMVARLLPGEDLETVNPSRPNSDADPWIQLMLRSIAVGAGLSYERMARDYSQTNYSSARASDLEDRREFRADQKWLGAHLCEPVWRRFVEEAVLSGIVDVSASELIGDYEEYTRHVWQFPGWEWVDPEKEANSSILAVDNNLSTLSEELGSRGRDLNETIEQRAKEKALIQTLLGAETDAEAREDGATANA